MRKFNDTIPKPEFNKFQVSISFPISVPFVNFLFDLDLISAKFMNFTETMKIYSLELAKETAFSLAALNFRFCEAPVAISFTEQT